MKKIFILIVSLVGITAFAAPSDSLRHVSGTYEAEFEATVSGKHTPFWFVSNRGGLGSVRKNTGFVRGAAHVAGSINRDWTWSGGLDLVAGWRTSSSFLVKELYGGIRYRDFEFTLGSKIDDKRLVDRRLSSGDLLFSGNSLPIPQARLSMPDYMMIPWVNNWLGFRAYFSMGMFTDGSWEHHFVPEGKRWYKNVMYHSKGILFRIGREDRFPLIFEGGLEMATQFGGKAMIGNDVVTTFPHSLKDIVKVILCQGGGGSQFAGEQSNVLGNHVGEWSARLSYTPAPGWKTSAYYLHFFEDHSMMFFNYTWYDGLYGFEAEFPSNRFVSKAVYEYMYTKNQSGPILHDSDSEHGEQVSGRDDYYNHSLYDGWQNRGMGIGNPLVISPVWNADHSLKFRCNRIIAHHIGLEGRPCDEISWRILASYTRGWGTYDNPCPEVEKNYNFLGEVTYAPRKLNGWSATAALGIDRGAMLGRSAGGMLSIRKSGLLK